MLQLVIIIKKNIKSLQIQDIVKKTLQVNFIPLSSKQQKQSHDINANGIHFIQFYLI